MEAPAPSWSGVPLTNAHLNRHVAELRRADKPFMRGDIHVNEWADCLGRLREARALILRDAEAFHEAATVLEHVGQVLAGEIRNGLGRYKKELLKLLNLENGPKLAEVERLFNLVRKNRNMAVHDGAWARHMSSRLIDLFLMLEEAVMKKMTTVNDIMVRDPVVAETWHMVAQARRTFLASSFSYLPILLGDQWRLLSDGMIMRFLRAAGNDEERKCRLAMQIGKAMTAGLEELPVATPCDGGLTIDKLPDLMGDQPVLVIEDISGAPRLLGIVTPFDLL